MKGIILAAGRGSRMGSMTEILPKCRTVLHGKELLQWQLDALQESGIEEVGIVRGYLSEALNYPVRYFDNNRWAETNMVMSLTMAGAWLENYDCLVSYSDIIYTRHAVAALKDVEADIAITYDPNWRDLWALRFDDPLTDAETFRLHDGYVTEIGKRADSMDEIEGQYMGLLKFTPNGWSQVSAFLSSITDKERDKLDVTKLLQALIETKVEIRAVPTVGTWYEVDTERDFNLYRGMKSVDD